MKNNGNNQNKGAYYIGLDVGTNSVGWAVTDKDYNVLKFKGNAMWGVRLFDEAQDASARRTSRVARRRLARRNQRLLLLQLLFAGEIAKNDPDFFIRMQESALHSEDKGGVKYSLFADKDFSDKDYYKKYPTIYHLRAELAESKEKHDARLVYLALHHIIKHRGHFLYDAAESGDRIITLSEAFADLRSYLEKEYGVELAPDDEKAFLNILERNDLGMKAKKKELRVAMGSGIENPISGESEKPAVNIASLCDMLAGATVKLSDLFNDEELKNAEIKSLCMKNSFDDKFDELSEILGERVELLVHLKTVCDVAKLSQICAGEKSISAAKVQLYEKNYRDLRLLKQYVKKVAPDKYGKIFNSKSKDGSYPSYSRYRSAGGDPVCTQEVFCKFLKKELPAPPADDTEMNRIFREIDDSAFLSRLKGSDNGVIPYQLHRQELVRILENASSYLQFLNERDADGLTVKEKIIKIFEFRVPYYVGPVSAQAKHHWAVRFAGKENEKVYPWNFEKIVDLEASAGAFIDNLIGICTYTGEKVLPKDSLLYSEYMLLNEINLLRVNGKPLPTDVKTQLVDHFFYASRKKVTKKKIKDYLQANNLIFSTDEISGIDDNIKTTLRSYHDLKPILDKTGDYDMVEAIIRSILIFGEDKAMLRRWLKKNTHDLDEADYRLICRLKYSDWGRLSEYFLTGIVNVEKDGTGKTIMDYLRSSDCNLMQLMSSEYKFASAAEEHRVEKTGSGQKLSDKLDSLYIAPAVRRSIRQTLRIVDEIVDIRKAAPEKIFIEMARGSREEMKNKRTESRKTKLTELYKACKEESNYLFEKLQNEDDNSLRSDKLYLYYLQLGKCMYSGEAIDFADLVRGERYDIDHIFPQSKVKDNSLDNRVLVKNVLNREKTNIYPISAEIRSKMLPTWTCMKKQGLISQKKFDRLTRAYPLGEKELSDFVARQLTETQQSTKALAQMLKNEYERAGTRIVYSKAGNVSDFRHDYDMLKCRDINDLHHAKDAYLNIVVGNVYNTRFTDCFFANIKSEKYSLKELFHYDTPGAWDKSESIKTVKKYMARNNVLVTRMPREVKGKLFEVQLKSAGKGQLDRKGGLPQEKYGGYGSLFTAYFFAVEYKKGKKQVRTIKPLPIVDKELFAQNPVLYCEDKLGLNEPRIIVDRILKDSLLELDGVRTYLSSKYDESRLTFENAYQLAIDYERTKTIRNISKYVERCKSRKETLEITEHDKLSHEKNVDLYDFFVQKSSQRVYADLLVNVNKPLAGHREDFVALSIPEQCFVLMEIIKAFGSHQLTINLSGIGAAANIKLKPKGMLLSGYKTARLINQSVTGLYETSVDLLG